MRRSCVRGKPMVSKEEAEENKSMCKNETEIGFVLVGK